MNFNIDNLSRIPLHLQIESQLRVWIDKNRDGGTLPNEIKLSDSFGVSRNTLRAAINRLVNEGLIERKQGVGTRIIPEKFRTNALKWKSFTVEMAEKGVSVENYDINFSFKTPTNEVIGSLNLENNKPIPNLRRLRGTDGIPVALFISYFHPKIALDDSINFNMPLYQILEEKFDIIPCRSRESIESIAANLDLSKLLNCSEGSPILKRKCLIYDNRNTPLEYVINYYKGDAFTYTVDLYDRNLSI